MGDVVGAGPASRQDRSGVGRLLPFGRRQQRIEIVFAPASHDNDPTERRQVLREPARHRLVVEMAENFRHDEDFRFGVPEHEGQLVLAEDRHERIEDRPDARAGEIKQGKLPPVRQLHGDDVVAGNAELCKADGDPVGERRELPVGEAANLAGLALHGGQRKLVRTGSDAGVQIVVDRPVEPVAARDAFGAPRT